jgi:hypothetical protein
MARLADQIAAQPFAPFLKILLASRKQLIRWYEKSEGKRIAGRVLRSSMRDLTDDIDELCGVMRDKKDLVPDNESPGDLRGRDLDDEDDVDPGEVIPMWRRRNALVHAWFVRAYGETIVRPVSATATGTKRGEASLSGEAVQRFFAMLLLLQEGFGDALVKVDVPDSISAYLFIVQLLFALVFMLAPLSLFVVLYLGVDVVSSELLFIRGGLSPCRDYSFGVGQWTTGALTFAEIVFYPLFVVPPLLIVFVAMVSRMSVQRRVDAVPAHLLPRWHRVLNWFAGSMRTFVAAISICFWLVIFCFGLLGLILDPEKVAPFFAAAVSVAAAVASTSRKYIVYRAHVQKVMSDLLDDAKARAASTASSAAAAAAGSLPSTARLSSDARRLKILQEQWGFIEQHVLVKAGLTTGDAIAGVTVVVALLGLLALFILIGFSALGEPNAVSAAVGSALQLGCGLAASLRSGRVDPAELDLLRFKIKVAVAQVDGDDDDDEAEDDDDEGAIGDGSGSGNTGSSVTDPAAAAGTDGVAAPRSAVRNQKSDDKRLRSRSRTLAGRPSKQQSLPKQQLPQVKEEISEQQWMREQLRLVESTLRARAKRTLAEGGSRTFFADIARVHAIDTDGAAIMEESPYSAVKLYLDRVDGVMTSLFPEEEVDIEAGIRSSIVIQHTPPNVRNIDYESLDDAWRIVVAEVDAVEFLKGFPDEVFGDPSAAGDASSSSHNSGRLNVASCRLLFHEITRVKKLIRLGLALIGMSSAPPRDGEDLVGIARSMRQAVSMDSSVFFDLVVSTRAPGVGKFRVTTRRVVWVGFRRATVPRIFRDKRSASGRTIKTLWADALEKDPALLYHDFSRW